MAEKPILFQSDMVKQILAGNKTMTRRVCKVQPDIHLIENCNGAIEFFQGAWGCKECGAYHFDKSLKCKWQIGDTLWVRETWRDIKQDFGEDRIEYKATEKINITEKWKPSIFMPRKAARIFLEITDIKVERLNDISEEDCMKEGAEQFPFDDTYKKAFQRIWESINGKGSWDLNPWVWAITFKKL